MSIDVSGQLTVYFDDPFWVGVFEKVEDDQLFVSRVVFGPEPRNVEVYEFVQLNYHRLKFSPPIEEGERVAKKRINPKCLQRQVKKTNEQNGIRTKAQEALQQAYELKKCEKKQRRKQQKEANKKLAFEMKQKKKKEKKRGH